MAVVGIVPTDIPGAPRLFGELDASNVEAVQARLEQEFADTRRLMLETSGLTFIDTQGIRMLIALGERAIVKGSVVWILNCSKALRRSLDVAVPGGIPGVEIVDGETTS